MVGYGMTYFLILYLCSKIKKQEMIHKNKRYEEKK